MWQNIILPGLEGEHPGPIYYLSPSKLYGLGIHDAYNNTRLVYTSTEFVGKNGMNNIASCLLRCLNYKRYYSQYYDKNLKMPDIVIIFDNYGGQNKSNVMIRFLNMIKERGFFGTSTLNFYIKICTKNYHDRAFNGLKVLCQKQEVFTFEECCEILNTSNNVEVIQMLHEKVFYLESFLNILYKRPDPKTVNINSAFQVKKESGHIGYHQNSHGESDSKQNYKKDNAYSGAQKKIRNRNIL